MSTALALRSIARLEFSELRRSRWLVTCLVIYAATAGLFVLVGLRESDVLGFTGVGRVLFSLCHALLLLLPLLALLGTAHAVARAREDGSLELLLSQPLRRSTWLLAAFGVRWLALVLPLMLLLLGLGVASLLLTGQAVPWGFLLRALLVCSALLFAFAALGILISVRVRSVSRATTWLLLAWVTSVALLDFALIGLLLQWRLPARFIFALAVVNPVQAARMALLAAAEPELAVLGPVGFYLATRVGSAGLLALGVGWPVAFGVTCWALALRAFRRSDVA